MLDAGSSSWLRSSKCLSNKTATMPPSTQDFVHATHTHTHTNGMGKDENLLLNINYIVDFDVIDCVHEDVRYAVPGKDQPKVSREFN